MLNLSFINKKEFTQSYRESFSQYLKKGLTSGLLNKELEDFDLAEIQNHLAPKRDLLFPIQRIAEDRQFTIGIS